MTVPVLEARDVGIRRDGQWILDDITLTIIPDTELVV